MPDLFIDDDKAIYMENKCIDDDLLKVDLNNSLNENIIPLGNFRKNSCISSFEFPIIPPKKF